MTAGYSWWQLEHPEPGRGLGSPLPTCPACGYAVLLWDAEELHYCHDQDPDQEPDPDHHRKDLAENGPTGPPELPVDYWLEDAYEGRYAGADEAPDDC